MTNDSKKTIMHGRQNTTAHSVQKGMLVLIGLLFCGYCGKPLKNTSYCNRWVAKRTGEEKIKFAGRYTCVEEHEGWHGYSQNYIEGIVFEVVEAYIDQIEKENISDDIVNMFYDHKRLCENKVKHLSNEQQKVLIDIETLEEYIPKALRGDAPFSTEKLSQLLKENENKLEQLKENEKAEAEKIFNTQFNKTEIEKFTSAVPNWKEEFYAADVSTKHMLLASIIDRIEVMDNNIKIIFKICFNDFVKDDSYTEKNDNFDIGVAVDEDEN